MTSLLESVEVRLQTVDDIVLARQKSRRFAEYMGFGMADQTRLATAVSELARNALQYAGGGWLLVSDRSSYPVMVLSAQVSDRGPGIDNLERAMKDGFTSGQGLGVGLPGCKRLMDAFSIHSSQTQGTTIVIELHAALEKRSDMSLETHL